MGGRGGSSGIYAGRFASGTAEQLARAETNLKNAISREKDAIASAKYMSGATKQEHLSFHNSQLKALTQQMNELQKEKKKRKKK